MIRFLSSPHMHDSPFKIGARKLIGVLEIRTLICLGCVTVDDPVQGLGIHLDMLTPFWSESVVTGFATKFKLFICKNGFTFSNECAAIWRDVVISNSIFVLFLVVWNALYGTLSKEIFLLLFCALSITIVSYHKCRMLNILYFLY